MPRRTRLFLLTGIITACNLCATAQEQQTEISIVEAKNYYKSYSKKRVTCHDPSVVWEPTTQRYYIFGSHLAQAYSSDLQNWNTFRAPWGAVQNDGSIISNIDNAKAFATHQVKTIIIGDKEIPFGNYDAHAWASAYGGDYSIDGNLWAPDIIYNKAMKKWCMYMSVNGPNHNCVIVLLTSDKIDGTYVYQGPVVYTGFKNATDERISWKKTDLELVLGEQTSLPTRYIHPNSLQWGDYWPNGIDPCVFYDETGKLWLSYGSWSGGIWMLELDEETGLRDYNVTYSSDYNTRGKSVTQDPYFGKKIAGGCYVSGEAPYIEYIGGYYYLFVTYGGLESTGGYQMRVFRSNNPIGPYVDGQGRKAIFDNYVMNYGPNADTRGQLIMGAYDKWGWMNPGELAQGHNSVIAAPNGQSYLVYHTRFNEGSEWHQVRVHQLYQNKEGWLVASPFEYNGSTTTDSLIATQETVSKEKAIGTWNIMAHSYSLNYKEREVVVPKKIVLHPDGTLSGAYKGTWSIEENTGYITIKLGTVTYQGVIVQEQMDNLNIQAYTFTACANNGIHIWGYKMREDYSLAYQLNNYTIPLNNGQTVSEHLNLFDIPLTDNVEMNWSSSHPQIISNAGRYNPTGLTENTDVLLSVRLSSGEYFWTNNYKVTARKESTPTADWSSDIVAHYDFDSTAIRNNVNPNEQAYLLRNGNNDRPTFEVDSIRNGSYIHLNFGANGNESYVSIPNPFYKKEIENGISISFWLKRADDNLWDAIWAFYNKSDNSRLYMTGNNYIGYNSNNGNWIDINHPNTYTNELSIGKWHMITITIGKTANTGIKIYIDGEPLEGYTYTGSLNGTDINRGTAFDYNLITNHITNCAKLTLGYGSFWGTPNISIDDLIIHNRMLSRFEISALKQIMSRVYDIGQVTDIEENINKEMRPVDNNIYDLSGRHIINPQTGIYIQNGKKIIIK